MKVAFVIERYWPTVGPDQQFVDRMANYLRAVGHRPVILSGMWEEHWPSRLWIRDQEVIRFDTGGWNLFSRNTMAKKISVWLRANPQQWDQVILVGQVEGADLVLQACSATQRTATVHFNYSGELGDWNQFLRMVNLHPNKKPWAQHRRWVVPDSQSKLQVQSACPAAKPLVWNEGTPCDIRLQIGSVRKRPGQLSPVDRQKIRASLWRSATGRSSGQSPLIVYLGGYEDPDLPRWLIRFLQGLDAAGERFEMWLMGDGGGLGGLHREVIDNGWNDRVFFPGYFQENTEVLASADLLLLPPTSRYSAQPLIEGLSVGVPILACDNSVYRPIIESAKNNPKTIASGLELLPEGVEIWVDAVSRTLKDIANGLRYEVKRWGGFEDPIAANDHFQDYFQWLTLNQ